VVTFKNNRIGGRRRSEVVSGIAAVAATGLLAASLGVAPAANAWCVSFGGPLTLGSGCSASLGSFALVLGPDESEAHAGLANEFSPFNIAIALGGTATAPNSVFAGHVSVPNLPSILNTAIATGGSAVEARGLFNLADAIAGANNGVLAAGVGNTAWAYGNDNLVFATGVMNQARVLLGTGNQVTASSNGDGLEALLNGFNTAFSDFGNDNVVGAVNGGLATAGALFVDAQNGVNSIIQSGFGINIKTPFNTITAAAASISKAANPSAAAANTETLSKQIDASIRKASKRIVASAEKTSKQADAAVKKAGKQADASIKKAGKQFNNSLKSLSRKLNGTS
jgi:hypothetical protein